jgi:predicted DsbA family dithiol-disulfide isomerase
MTPDYSWFLAATALVGLLISILSALESRITWVAKFCELFGSGCKLTERFTLFTVPIAFWGAVFYILVLAATVFIPATVFWLVMLGLGFELMFVAILAVKRISCIFCILNAFVILVLAVAVFSANRFWQAAALALASFIAASVLLFRENRAELMDEGREQEGPEAAARVNDRLILERDIERSIVPELHDLEVRAYQLKRKELEKAIREALLEEEAAARGLTIRELARDILCDFGNGVENSKRKREDCMSNFADSLREKHSVQVFMQEPPLPCVRIRISGSPSTGPQQADVVVIEFSDYLCPACREGHKMVEQLKPAFKDRVRWVFMNFPLPMHPGAERMAQAALCAHEQDAFRAYQQRMFDAPGALDDQALIEVARELGLDEAKFEACLLEDRYSEKVEKDVEEGRLAGVNSTPSFFIKGRLVRGVLPAETFAKLIEEELERSE